MVTEEDIGGLLSDQCKADEERVRSLPTTAVVTDSLDRLLDAGMKFGTTLVDPPWEYQNRATRAAACKHYKTLTLDAIHALPVSQLAARDAHLHLWTTSSFLREAFGVIDAWGFSYRSAFVWVKDKMGTGNYYRCSHEYLLLGVRGNATRFRRRDQRSWAEYPRTKHSRKPRQIREMIERVSPGPYLELFATEPIDGWVAWGDQIRERQKPLFPFAELAERGKCHE